MSETKAPYGVPEYRLPASDGWVESRNVPTFKTEASLWQMMLEGKKTWDARIHDITDDRIYKLMWNTWDSEARIYRCAERYVAFLNKTTGQVLVCFYQGCEFSKWAPGWVFLGIRNYRLVEPDGEWQDVRHPR